MPIEFIPNQAAIFEEPIGSQPCLNNDNKSYNQLAQPGDTLCVQWKMLPCDEPLCEPNMYEQTGDQLIKEWTGVGTGWTTSGSDNGQFSLVTPTPSSSCELDQCFTGIFIVGNVYRINFTINSITGNYPLNLRVAFPSTFTNTSYTQAGTYDFYFIATSTDHCVIWSWETGGNDVTEAETCDITSMNMYQVTSCWKDELVDIGGFMYPGWLYNYQNTNGRFCRRDVTATQTTLTNTLAYINSSNYHGVAVTIEDLTVGAVTVELGGTNLGVLSENGQYTLYGVPSNVSQELKFIPTAEFDGCITKVNVLDYGQISSRFSVYLINSSNTIASNSFVPDTYDDRIVFCKLWTELDLDFNGDCELYRIRLYDECQDEAYELHTSINQFAYKQSGWECTKIVESWDDGYAFGFYFGAIANPNFKLYQRLRVLQFNPKYSNTTEDYLYSSGGRTRTYAESQKYRDCWFDYVDEYAHDCIRTQLLCNKLNIDGYFFYYKAEEYEPTWNESFKYNLAQSRVELIHEKVIFGSYCGTQSNALCPPQIVPTPTGELTNLKFTALFRFEKAYNVASVSFFRYLYDQDGAPSTVAGLAGGPFNLNNAGSRTTLLNNIISQCTAIYGGSSSGTINFITTTNYYELQISVTGTVSVFGTHNTVGFASAVYLNIGNAYWDSSLFMVNLY